MGSDLHCAACQGTDYIGRPCRGRTNFREERDAARALAAELAEALGMLHFKFHKDTERCTPCAALAKWEASK